MKQISSAVKVLSLWTFVTLISMVWAIEIEWTKYEFEDSSVGVTCASSEHLFFRDNIPDSFACSTICFLHDSCLTAEFKPESNQCIGCLGLSNPAMPGSENSTHFSRMDYHTDCKDILERNKSAKYGVYEIRLISTERIDVYCDMSTDGGGWTLFQKRHSKNVDFNRTFQAYENGFGYLQSDFWLGLRYLQKLTYIPSELMLYVVTESAMALFEKYDNFELIGEKYEITTLDNLRESTPFKEKSTFTTLLRRPFYTYDMDLEHNCARSQGGGWWFPDDIHRCETTNLNGKHPEHFRFTGTDDLVVSYMMVRRQ